MENKNSMELTQHVINSLLGAESKALATTGPEGLNVVPVSSIRIEGSDIWLFNYFMKKTLGNIRAEPTVALVGWSGLSGFQVRAHAEHITDGPRFEDAKRWVAERLPDRTLRSLLILTPETIYDISPAAQ